MSQAAEGLKEQLYQHYYALTKNAANFLRSPEKQAEADKIMKQIEAINTSQAPAAAPAARPSKEEILMSLFDSYTRFSRFPPSEYRDRMKQQVQAAYSRENPGVNLETVYQQLLGKSKGGARRKTRNARKTRKNRT